MVDWYGNWYEEEDYSKYPKEKWCDMDYMAVWIRSKNYEVETTMENLINMILAHYEYDEDVVENGYFAFEDAKDSLMIHVPDVEEYVNASGGLYEFDYYC